MNGLINPWKWLVSYFIVASLLAGAAEGQTKHPVTLYDLGQLRTVDNMQLSPDGQMLAYAVQTAPTAARRDPIQSEIWVISTEKGGIPRRIGSGTLPIWSPNSKRLAYYSGAEGAFQLWVFDIESGHVKQVTELEGGIDPDPRSSMIGWYYDPLLFSWSPDNTKLIFASQMAATHTKSHANDEEMQDPNLGRNSRDKLGMPLVLTLETPPQWTLRGVFSHDVNNLTWAHWEKASEFRAYGTRAELVRKSNQLFIVDVDSKNTTQLTKDPGGYFNPEWSPDGTQIVCGSSEGRYFSEGSATNIYAIEIASGKKTALTAGSGDKRLPIWSPDGKWIAYFGGGYSGVQAVFLIPAAGGKTFNVTAKLDRYIQGFRWFSDSKSIIVLAHDGVSTPVLRVDIQGSSFDRLTEEAAYRAPITVSRSGTIAWAQSDGSSPGEIRVLPRKTSSPYVLVNLNPQSKEWELGLQEIVRWKNHRGDDLEGILIKPVGYREGHRYSVVVDCYPGLTARFRGNPMFGNHVWAARGYVIFNPSGARAPHVWRNAFKSAAYSQAAMGPRGWDVTVDDVMSGVDELIGQGIVDPERMCLYGFSNGGGVVNYLVTRTNRFKCAVSVASVYPDWVRPVFLELNSRVITFAGGITPWDDPEGYIQLSAVFHLKKVTTPMLLADGDNDNEFLLGMIEMYNGLRWLGKEVTLLRYPDQGHGFTGAAMKDFWERENAFFDKYLKPTESSN